MKTDFQNSFTDICPRKLSSFADVMTKIHSGCFLKQGVVTPTSPHDKQQTWWTTAHVHICSTALWSTGQWFSIITILQHSSHSLKWLMCHHSNHRHVHNGFNSPVQTILVGDWWPNVYGAGCHSWCQRRKRSLVLVLPSTDWLLSEGTLHPSCCLYDASKHSSHNCKHTQNALH